MFKPDELILKLKNENLSEIARVTGYHYNTVYRFANNEIKKPTYDFIEALSDFFIQYR